MLMPRAALGIRADEAALSRRETCGPKRRVASSCPHRRQAWLRRVRALARRASRPRAVAVSQRLAGSALAIRCRASWSLSAQWLSRRLALQRCVSGRLAAPRGSAGIALRGRRNQRQARSIRPAFQPARHRDARWYRRSRHVPPCAAQARSRSVSRGSRGWWSAPMVGQWFARRGWRARG